MVKNCLVIWAILSGIFFLFGCAKTKFPDLSVAEEKMMMDCQYLDTISETSDPGKFVTNYQFVRYYDGELKVLERANNMEATHIVWMYNHPIGSSASAYRCVK
jgi:hypothetical protein